MRLKYLAFLANGLVLLMLSCNQNSIQIDDVLFDTIFISAAATTFYTEHSEWPDSVEDLKAFCSRKHLKTPCPELDWEIYSETEFKKLPDGNLEIRFYSKTEKIQITFTVPTPEECDE